MTDGRFQVPRARCHVPFLVHGSEFLQRAELGCEDEQQYAGAPSTLHPAPHVAPGTWNLEPPLC